MKKERAITLIALIITIIVMLILVGVTVNVALNGGLFSTARHAKEEMEKEKDREELYSIVAASYDAQTGEISLEVLRTKATAEGWNVTGESFPVTCTSPKGNAFTVDEKGNIGDISAGLIINPTEKSLAPGDSVEITVTKTLIAESEEITYTSNNENVTLSQTTGATTTARVSEDANIGEIATITATCAGKTATCTITVSDGTQEATLEDYLFGKEVEGVRLGRLLVGLTEETKNDGIMHPETMQFLRDPDDENSTIHENIKLAYMTEGYDVYIRYNRNVYKFSFDSTYNTIPDSLYTVNEVTGNLGKYVTYNGLDWIVLSESGNTVELISANALQVNSQDIKLGYEDSNAPDNLEEIYDDSNLNYEKGRWSYNNAIATLNAAARTACRITDESIPVRNAGANITDGALSELNTVVFSNLTEFTPDAEVTFEKYQGATYGLRKGDVDDHEAITGDLVAMKNIGVLASDNVTTYWLASRFVYEDSSFVNFSIRYVYDNGNLSYNGLCYVYYGGSANGDPGEHAVRPIITLQSSLIASQL